MQIHYRYRLFFILYLLIPYSYSQSFAPAPEEIGSTAIFKDSSIIINWANEITLQRGYLSIADKSLGFASYGTETNALFQAEGNSFDVVSLGDSGVAILKFPKPIRNGEGPDFAVFENGFANHYIEYAFVEVSSDGVNFVRFPSISETPTNNQMGNFEYSDCRYVHNLAGKYRQGYGTPFDLEELANEPNLNIDSIVIVKLIDVIGSIDPNYASFDSQGNIINDPWPSNFESGGFDLDAVGVIHQKQLSSIENINNNSFHETFETIMIESTKEVNIQIFSMLGEKIYESTTPNTHHEIVKRNSKMLSIITITDDEHSSVKKVFY